jgi:ATP-dependent Lhr-like helicase
VRPPSRRWPSWWRRAERVWHVSILDVDRGSISAVDPLNLAGIVTPGEKIARLPGNRLLFECGAPIAVHLGGEVRCLTALDAGAQWAVKNLLIRRQRPGSYMEGAGTPQ